MIAIELQRGLTLGCRRFPRKVLKKVRVLRGFKPKLLPTNHENVLHGLNEIVGVEWVLPMNTENYKVNSEYYSWRTILSSLYSLVLHKHITISSIPVRTLSLLKIRQLLKFNSQVSLEGPVCQYVFSIPISGNILQIIHLHYVTL